MARASIRTRVTTEANPVAPAPETTRSAAAEPATEDPVVVTDQPSRQWATPRPRRACVLPAGGSMTADADTDKSTEDLQLWERNRGARQVELDAANEHGRQFLKRYGAGRLDPALLTSGHADTERRQRSAESNRKHSLLTTKLPLILVRCNNWAVAGHAGRPGTKHPLPNNDVWVKQMGTRALFTHSIGAA